MLHNEYFLGVFFSQFVFREALEGLSIHFCDNKVEHSFYQVLIN